MQSRLTSPAPSRRRDDLIFVAFLFVVLLATYLSSPVRHLSDSRYTMLLSEHVLLHGSFDLAPYFTPYVDSSDYPKVRWDTGLPRHVRRHGEQVFHIYPYGSSLLSLPLLAGLRVLGFSTMSTIDDHGRYSDAGEMRIQAVVASLLAALAGLLFYATARQLLALEWSVAVALAGALGSQLWSTVSRVLWSHTWGVLLLALALFLLLRSEVRRGGEPSWYLHPLLATVLAWGFFVRPTAVAYIVPVTAYVAWRHRRSLPFVVTGLLWLAAFLALNLHVFGQPLPEYYLRFDRQQLASLGVGLAANLLSPARGLLVYSPWLLLVVYVLVRYRSRLRHPALAVTALAAIALHVLIVSGNDNWWGGSCYGPRLTTETVPLWILLTVLAWRAALDERAAARASELDRWRRRAARLTAAAAVLLAVSGTLHGAGALSRGWVEWTANPVPVQQQPARVFEWREAPFLWALFPHRGEPYISPLRGRLARPGRPPRDEGR